MHPPLKREHPECEDVVRALMICHRDKPYMKFIGGCNSEKAALDMCFRKEKENTRSGNMRKARDWQKKYADAKAKQEL